MDITHLFIVKPKEKAPREIRPIVNGKRKAEADDGRPSCSDHDVDMASDNGENGVTAEGYQQGVDGCQQGAKDVKKYSGGISKFKDRYKMLFPFISRSRKGEMFFYCSVCEKDYNFSKHGISRVRSHAETEAHIRNSKAAKDGTPCTASASSTVSIASVLAASFAASFAKEMNSSSSSLTQGSQVNIAEAVWAFHVLNHRHSFSTSDCVSRLLPSMFPDSKIAELCELGSAKLVSIVESVLAPLFRKKVISDVGDLPYSLSADSFSFRQLKVFPITVRYVQCGKVYNRLLALRSLPEENSSEIFEMLCSTIAENGLSWRNFVCFATNNAAQNFEQTEHLEGSSVSSKLQQTKRDLYEIGCYSRVVRSAASSAADRLGFDVEAFCLKIISYFGEPSLRVESLSEFCEFIQNHCATFPFGNYMRWLSLIPLIDRILRHWSVLKSFCLSDSNDSYFLRKAFEDERSEIYCAFLHGALSMFQAASLRLQSGDLTLPDAWEVFEKLVRQLENRISGRHYGVLAVKVIHRVEEGAGSTMLETVKNEFMQFYQMAIAYINVRVDSLKLSFPPSLVSWMTVTKSVDYSVVLQLAERLIADFADGETLYDEVCKLNSILEEVREKEDFKQSTISAKWQIIFKEPNLKILNRIVSIVFCLPCSNSFCEKIFSLLNVRWTDESDSLQLSALSNIICCIVNSDVSDCNEMCTILSSLSGINALEHT